MYSIYQCVSGVGFSSFQLALEGNADKSVPTEFLMEVLELVVTTTILSLMASYSCSSMG